MLRAIVTLTLLALCASAASAQDAARGRQLFENTRGMTGKPVGNVTRYTYSDGDERYVVAFTRFSDLAADKFIDHLHGPKKAAAMLVGFDGAYLRFAGELRIEHYRDEQLVDSYSEGALWELMYFGKARP